MPAELPSRGCLERGLPQNMSLGVWRWRHFRSANAPGGDIWSEAQQCSNVRFPWPRMPRKRNRIEHALRAALRVVRLAQVPAM